MTIYYTGIGSRETPGWMLSHMRGWAIALASFGFTLRSGGADGADTAFEQGCDKVKGTKEIYLPWKGFNNNTSQLYNIPEKAFEIASEHHPGWKYLKEPVKKLMARNVLQVLGETLDTPSAFVICWTPDGCYHYSTRGNKTGGTGQAIALASKLNIPVLNLKSNQSDGLIFEIIDKQLATR